MNDIEHFKSILSNATRLWIEAIKTVERKVIRPFRGSEIKSYKITKEGPIWLKYTELTDMFTFKTNRGTFNINLDECTSIYYNGSNSIRFYHKEQDGSCTQYMIDYID